VYTLRDDGPQGDAATPPVRAAARALAFRGHPLRACLQDDAARSAPSGLAAELRFTFTATCGRRHLQFSGGERGPGRAATVTCQRGAGSSKVPLSEGGLAQAPGSPKSAEWHHASHWETGAGACLPMSRIGSLSGNGRAGWPGALTARLGPGVPCSGARGLGPLFGPWPQTKRPASWLHCGMPRY
jgi:hypothetical protein